MADDDCGVSTPKAPRELRQRLKNGEITGEQFERERLAIKTGAAKARLSLGAAPEIGADSPSSPSRTLSRQFSELMDPEVRYACSVCPSRCGDKITRFPRKWAPDRRAAAAAPLVAAAGYCHERVAGSPGMCGVARSRICSRK